MKQIIIISIVIVCISCNNPAKKEIARKSLISNIQKIKKKSNNLDSAKIEFLNYIQTSEGNLLVENLEQNKLTYADIFKQIEAIESIKKKYREETRKIKNKIDSVCNLKTEKVNNFIQDEKNLNNLVNIRIKSIVNTVWDVYGDAVQLQTKIINNTGKTIKELNFYLKIVNQLISDSVIIPCKIELPIQHALDYSFVYDEKVHPKIAPFLSLIKFPNCKCSYQIVSINTKNELFKLNTQGIENLISDYFSNPNAENPSDFCKYMDKDNKLETSLNEIIDKKNTKINKEYHLLNQYYR